MVPVMDTCNGRTFPATYQMFINQYEAAPSSGSASQTQFVVFPDHLIYAASGREVSISYGAPPTTHGPCRDVTFYRGDCGGYFSDRSCELRAPWSDQILNEARVTFSPALFAPGPVTLSIPSCFPP